MILLPLAPPFPPLHPGTHYIYPAPTVSPIYRENPHRWEVSGRQNQILLIRDRSKKTNVSAWGRCFGSIPVPVDQDGLDEILSTMERLAMFLGVSYDAERPPSISAMARELLTPFLWQIWRPTCGQPGKAARAAIYGGRMEVFRASHWGACTLTEYDLPSCYPTILAGDIPFGVPYALPRADFMNTRLAELWWVEINAPTRFMGFLPFRDPIAGVIYPNGRWEGCYWVRELVLAKEYGYRFKPLKGWGFQTNDVLAQPMKLLAKAASMPEFAGIAGAVKRLAVACVGLLAQRGQATEIVSGEPNEGDVPLSLQDALWIRRVGDGKGKPLPWNREQVASYVWSMGRVKLLDAMLGVPRETLIQCHTDGFIVDREIPFILSPWRAKRTWKVEEGFECPYRGALYIDKRRVKAPGKKENEG